MDQITGNDDDQDQKVLNKPSDPHPRRHYTCSIATKQGEAMNDYIKTLWTGVATGIRTEATCATHEASLASWLVFLDTVEHTDAPTAQTIVNFAKWLTRTQKAPATVNTYLEILRAFMKWHLNDEEAANQLTKQLGATDRRDEPLPAIAPDQMQYLLTQTPPTSLRGCRDRLLVLMLYRTACETISLHRADIGDIDLIRRRWMHQPRGYRTKEFESELGEDLCQEIERYLIRRGHGDDQALFVAAHINPVHRNRLSTLSMRLSIRRMLLKANLVPELVKKGEKIPRMGSGCLRLGGLSERAESSGAEASLGLLPRTRLKMPLRTERLEKRLRRARILIQKSTS